MAQSVAAVQRSRRAAAVVSEEERRRNRMTSNRLSARKSREKRRQREEELAALAERLGRENEAMRAGADAALQRCQLLEQENRVLAAHAQELCATLALRNAQLAVLGEFAGVPLDDDVLAIPDHLAQLYGGGGTPMPLPPPPPGQQYLVAPLPMDIDQMLYLEPGVVMDAVGMLREF